MVKALVVWATELGINLLAELARVRGGYVLVKSFLVLPDFDDRDVIAARDFRAGFHSHDARIFARIHNVLLNQFCARGRLWRDDIDVRHDVNPVVRARLLSERLPNKSAGSQN